MYVLLSVVDATIHATHVIIYIRPIQNGYVYTYIAIIIIPDVKWNFNNQNSILYEIFLRY